MTITESEYMTITESEYMTITESEYMTITVRYSEYVTITERVCDYNREYSPRSSACGSGVSLGRTRY